MSNTISNQTLTKMMMTSSPIGNQKLPQMNIKGGRRIRRTRKTRRTTRRRKRLLGGASEVAVANTPHNVVSPGVTDMYKQLNQAQATNSVQSMTDGGGRRRKTRRRRRKRSI